MMRLAHRSLQPRLLLPFFFEPENTKKKKY
jgi:hypothetical protein